MPTIDDLRAALESLEAAVPTPDDVFSKLAIDAVPGQRRRRRWMPLTATVALAVTGVVAVVGLAAVVGRPGRPSPARPTSDQVAAGGQGRPLPFRLTGSVHHLTVLDVHSDTDLRRASGHAVLAEYGMEVTIDVTKAAGDSAHSASASPVSVRGRQGWIDTSCPVRAAPSSAAQVANPTCSLSYDSGPWHVAIYVAGPGGGSRKITRQQFLDLGDRLLLATSPSDRSTWFDSDTLLPK